MLQDLNKLFSHPVTKNLKAGGRLAFSLVSLTAITYPFVATFQAVGSIQAQVQVLTAQGQAQAQALAAIAAEVHSIKEQMDKCK